MKLIQLALGLVIAFSPSYALHAQEAANGGIDEVDVVKTTATVEKVDLEHRKVALLLEDGKTKTFKVDKSVENLDRVKPGDRLKMTYTDELVVYVGKTGEAPSASSGGFVKVAAKGDKPGAYMVNTETTSGKVLDVDPEKHRVTLEEANGHKKTVKVSKKITNLDRLKVGESIDVAITETLAIAIVQ
jgi:Cu/Ag efflux protein CusF